MPRTCTICGREDQAEIDAELVTPSVTLRNIAQRYDTTATTLYRHAKHLPQELVVAQEAKQVAAADRLLAELDRLRQRATEILDTTEKEEVSLKAIKEARGCIETLFKVAEIMQEQRFKPEEVEFWTQRLFRLFQVELRDVAAGKKSAEESLELMAEEIARGVSREAIDV